MAAQKGTSMVLKIGNGASPQTFTTVGGCVTNDLTINEQPVDLTNKSSTDRWQEQARMGVKSMSFSGSGKFLDDSGVNAVRANVFGSAIVDWQSIVPGLGTFEGPMIITQFKITGQDKDAVTFDIAVQSAGVCTFV